MSAGGGRAARGWDAMVEPGGVGGAIAAIASKSAAHRILILAALADAETQVACSTTSRDIEATAACLEALGAGVERCDGGFLVRPVPREADGSLALAARGTLLDCGESGSTLRFMLPVACALGAEATLTGSGRLPERPLSPLRELLEAHGNTLSPAGAWPVQTGGRMEGGDFELRGDVSSQFVTGLLLAASACGQAVRVEVRPPVESRPYIDLTLACLARFGLRPQVRDRADGGLAIALPEGARAVTPGRLAVEGDWSNAAFWLCAGAIGPSPVTVTGLDTASTQGDRAVVDILRRFGAQVEVNDAAGEVCARPGRLQGITIDAGDIPDLCVPLSMVAACAQGTTHIVNAARLRAKESDRLASVAQTLRALGAEVQEGPDSLTVEGRGAGSGADPCLAACTVDSFNDHRIAMAAAIAATRAEGPVTITGARAVTKSYPRFFEDYRRLGGQVAIVEEG